MPSLAYQDCPGSGSWVLVLDTQMMTMKATIASAIHELVSAW